MSFRVPKYRLHKGSGQALVQFGKRRIYLGKYGLTKGKEKYRRVVAEALTRPDLPAATQFPSADGGLVVANSTSSTAKQELVLLRRLESAQRWHLVASKSLEQVRKMLDQDNVAPLLWVIGAKATA